MFDVIPPNEVETTKLDTTSIMMYRIPKAWTNDGTSSEFNDKLSDVDKKFIRKAVSGLSMPLLDYALVVGINRYPKIKKLTGAQTDAEEFYNWVTDPAGGGVAKTNALLLRSSDFDPPPDPDDERPDKVLVEEFFTRHRQCRRGQQCVAGDGLQAPGARLWLFFSGHGFAPSLDRSGVLMANADA